MRVLGVSERGVPTDGPLDRRTGTGWVSATTDHDYADALSKGNGVSLLVTETSGALSTGFALLLRILGRQSRTHGARDSTCYGASRASPHTFFAHHIAAISSAIVFADATTVLNAASHLSYLLSAGMGG